MKRIYYLIGLGLLFGTLAYMLAAQETTAPVKPSTPTLSVELQKRFWKAQSESQQASDTAKEANQAAQQKQVILQGIVEEMKKVCGDGFQLQLVDGDVGCAVKVAVRDDKK